MGSGGLNLGLHACKTRTLATKTPVSLHTHGNFYYKTIIRGETELYLLFILYSLSMLAQFVRVCMCVYVFVCTCLHMHVQACMCVFMQVGM